MKPVLRDSFPNLSNFFTDDLFFSNFLSKDVYPAVNVKENDKGYELEVVAPGIKKDGFKLEIDDDMMTISGEAESSKEKETKKYYRKEYNFESFSRQFILPENTLKDDVKAEYTDGVLRIKIAKETKTKAKEKKAIPIS